MRYLFAAICLLGIIATTRAAPVYGELDYRGHVSYSNTVSYSTATEMTLTAGALTPTVPVIAAQPETLTADELTTVHAARVGQVLWLTVAEPATDVIVVKHGAGNLSLPGAQDITLTHGALQLVSQADGSWVAVGGGGGSGAVTWDDVEDKPAFADVATSGDYDDLSNRPDLSALPTGGGTNNYAWTANGTTAGWSPVSATSIASTSISFAATETIVANVGYPYPDEYTKLLLHFDDASNVLVDMSESAHALSKGSAIDRSAVQSKFGGYSILGTASADSWVGVPDSDDFNFGSGDFSVDFWVRITAWDTFDDANVLYHMDGAAATGLAILISDSGAEISATNRNGGAGVFDITVSSTFSLNSWYHIALVRYGGTVTLYKNGTSIGSHAVSGAVGDSSRPVLLGNVSQSNGATAMRGYLDEFRVSKGIARWTANFSAPTAPYEDSRYDVQEIPLTTGAQAFLASPEVSAASTGSLLVQDGEMTPLRAGPARYVLTSVDDDAVPAWSPQRFAPDAANWTLDQYNASRVVYWPLDEMEGPRYDLVNRTALGEVNTVDWTSGVGGTGRAALFTAANSEYLLGRRPFAAASTTKLAVSWWFKATSLPSTDTARTMLSVGSGATYQAFGSYLYNSAGTTTIRFNCKAGSGDTYLTGPTVVAGTWYHVGVYIDLDNSLMIGYVNGSATSTATPSSGFDTSSGALSVGCNYLGGSPINYFDGAMQALDIRPGLEFADATEREAFFAALYNSGTPPAVE
jgi:hypothetical protein